MLDYLSTILCADELTFLQIYQNFKNTVSYFFEDSTVGDSQLTASQHNMGYMGQQRSPGGGPLLGQLNPSTRSFKVVTECPLIVMFLFQLYPRYVQTNIPLLLPLMVNAISITGPSQVPPNLKNAFAELKGAQVKVSYRSFHPSSMCSFWAVSISVGVGRKKTILNCNSTSRIRERVGETNGCFPSTSCVDSPGA